MSLSKQHMKCTSAASAVIWGLAWCLRRFVALVFGLTIAKVSNDDFCGADGRGWKLMAMDPKTKTVTPPGGCGRDLMGGLAWASVPFYDWFCRVTGFGGTPGVATAGADDVLDQTIKIRFDASKERDMPWEFKPMAREMEIGSAKPVWPFTRPIIRPTNPLPGSPATTSRPTRQVVFSSRSTASAFTEQVLQPGERVEMPVTFYVDPEIVTDRDAKYTHTITLSYTFYEIDLPEEHAALAQDAETDKNKN